MLILVGGPPATGKTTIGRNVAKEFDLPFIGKDDIKERLFDDLGYRDREWSLKVGKASWHVLYGVIEELVSHGQSLVAEANFGPEHDEEPIKALKTDIVQVHCTATPEVLLKRFEERVRSGKRHPGHRDEGNLDDVRTALDEGRHAPLRLDGPLVVVDTTDIDAIDYPDLFTRIRSAMRAA